MKTPRKDGKPASGLATSHRPTLRLVSASTLEGPRHVGMLGYPGMSEAYIEVWTPEDFAALSQAERPQTHGVINGIGVFRIVPKTLMNSPEVAEIRANDLDCGDQFDADVAKEAARIKREARKAKRTTG